MIIPGQPVVQNHMGSSKHATYYARNRERILARNRIKNRTLDGWSTNARSGCKTRAARQNVVFKLSKDYLKSIFPEDGCCPFCFTKMEIGHNNIRNSPSVDRLIPELGYVPGNVMVICFRCNSIKSDASVAEVEKVLAGMKKVGCP